MTDFLQSKLLNITKQAEIEHMSIDTTAEANDDYASMFEKVQRYIVNNKLTDLTEALNTNNYSVLEQLVRNYIKKEFPAFAFNETKCATTMKKVMADMTGYGFLNKYFADKANIEEININGWDAIEVRYRDGVHTMIDEHFMSVQQAKDVILRILQQNNKHMDENKVYEISYIGKAVRIATTITPVADKEIGVVASIRFIHSAIFTLDALVENKMLPEGAAKLLMAAISHGVSICFCGSTGSGKTTVCNALLANIDDNTRIITLEGGTREFDLIKKSSTGKTLNNRVHLQTRPHINQSLNVDLQLLLDLVLKFDPDIVAVGEMVSEEAFIASETARTGHTVVTTIHTNNAYDAYYRMFTLGIRKYSLEENIMLKFMVDAFPLIVYTKKYSDGKRRMQCVLEGSYKDNQIIYNDLFRFEVEDNIYNDDGTITVNGEFKRINSISNRLRQIMIDNGLRKTEAEQL